MLCTYTQLLMRVTSPAFHDGEIIPSKYTCDGKDINPELHIDGVPAQAKCLALIVDDPDSPSGNWLHWSVWNIAPDTKVIHENTVPAGAVEGETDFSEVGYGGPCPGSGEHEYRFMAFALDATLNIPYGSARSVIEEAMMGHVLAHATLTGRYQRIKMRTLQHA